MKREHPWTRLIAIVLLVVAGLVEPAGARKFQMSGTWLMREGQVFVPLQFASSSPGMDQLSMGNWTKAPFDPPGQVVSDAGPVTATGSAPAALRIPKHRFVWDHDLVLPLFGTMLVQITTMVQIDAPFDTASLAQGGGPGNLTWCPSNPACTPGGFPPGPIGNRGRIVYVAGSNRFGGTMQMGLANGGVLSFKGVGPGVVGHVKFLRSGPTLQNLAVGGPQAGSNTPATEFEKLAAGILTAPIGGIPASGMLITMPGPVVGMFPSLTTPMGGMTGQFTTDRGFGHTTGTVIVQQGSYNNTFFTVMGSDARTPLGAGNIAVVAGGLSRRNTLAGPTSFGTFHRISLSLGAPVPSLSPSGFAAAGVLILLAVGYAFRRRLGERSGGSPRAFRRRRA